MVVDQYGTCIRQELYRESGSSVQLCYVDLTPLVVMRMNLFLMAEHAQRSLRMIFAHAPDKSNFLYPVSEVFMLASLG